MRSSLMWIVKGLFFYVRAFDLNSKEIVRGIGEGISKIVSFVLWRTLFRYGFSEYVVCCFCFIYPFYFDFLYNKYNLKDIFNEINISTTIKYACVQPTYSSGICVCAVRLKTVPQTLNLL